MSDLIDRQAAIDEAKKRHDFFRGATTPADKARRDELLEMTVWLSELPSAQPERKKGKWIKLDMHAHLADHKCTACDQECYVPTCMGEPMYTYCPNCGADMRGTEYV